MSNEPYVMKVGELLEELKGIDPTTDLYFGTGDLSFYRVKRRGENLVHIDFNQVYSIEIDPESD